MIYVSCLRWNRSDTFYVRFLKVASSADHARQPLDSGPSQRLDPCLLVNDEEKDSSDTCCQDRSAP